MNARERARFDTIKRVGDFGTTNATDFTAPVPPAVTVSPALTKAQGLFDALNHPATGLLATISANATAQQSDSGDFHGGATAKSVLRSALMLELRGLNRSAVRYLKTTNDVQYAKSCRDVIFGTSGAIVKFPAPPKTAEQSAPAIPVVKK